MNLAWTPDGWDDYLYWQRTDKKTLKRINTLIAAVVRDPYAGVGKPEPLRHQWTGYWSRRIDREHRLVYKATDAAIIIVQCRYHY